MKLILLWQIKSFEWEEKVHSLCLFIQYCMNSFLYRFFFFTAFNRCEDFLLTCNSREMFSMLFGFSIKSHTAACIMLKGGCCWKSLTLFLAAVPYWLCKVVVKSSHRLNFQLTRNSVCNKMLSFHTFTCIANPNQRVDHQLMKLLHS